MTCLSNNKMNGWKCEKHPNNEFMHVIGGSNNDANESKIDYCDSAGTRCLCQWCDHDGK